MRIGKCYENRRYRPRLSAVFPGRTVAVERAATGIDGHAAVVGFARGLGFACALAMAVVAGGIGLGCIAGAGLRAAANPPPGAVVVAAGSYGGGVQPDYCRGAA